MTAGTTRIIKAEAYVSGEAKLSIQQVNDLKPSKVHYIFPIPPIVQHACHLSQVSLTFKKGKIWILYIDK